MTVAEIAMLQLFWNECEENLYEWGTVSEEERVRRASLFPEGEARLFCGPPAKTSLLDEPQGH